MAENKKSFLLYCDLIHTVEKMPIDKAGELFLHILRYVNDETPVTNDLIIQLTFEPIKQALKRDLDKWEGQLEQRRQAGLRSAELRRQNSTSVNERSISSTDNVIVSVNVNDSVNDSVNDILLKKETKNIISVFSFKKSLIDYGFDKSLVDDWLKVRKTKKATNTETAFNSFISEIENRQCDINEILTECVKNSWSGFKHEWIDNLNKKQNGTTTNTTKFKTVSNAFAERLAKGLQSK